MVLHAVAQIISRILHRAKCVLISICFFLDAHIYWMRWIYPDALKKLHLNMINIGNECIILIDSDTQIIHMMENCITVSLIHWEIYELINVSLHRNKLRTVEIFSRETPIHKIIWKLRNAFGATSFIYPK